MHIPIDPTGFAHIRSRVSYDYATGKFRFKAHPDNKVPGKPILLQSHLARIRLRTPVLMAGRRPLKLHYKMICYPAAHVALALYHGAPPPGCHLTNFRVTSEDPHSPHKHQIYKLNVRYPGRSGKVHTIPADTDYDDLPDDVLELDQYPLACVETPMMERTDREHAERRIMLDERARTFFATDYLAHQKGVSVVDWLNTYLDTVT